MKKKILVSGAVFLIILLTAGIASASGRYPHYRHYHHSGFGIIIGPPVIWSPPVYYRGYYYPPPYHYYTPRYYWYGDYGYNYRVWVPGYWEERWSPYGWEKVWVPGYWRYDP